MDRYPDILEDILHFDEDSDDEWDMLLAETKREEESRSKRRNKHRGSVPGHRIIRRGRVEGHERLSRLFRSELCI